MRSTTPYFSADVLATVFCFLRRSGTPSACAEGRAAITADDGRPNGGPVAGLLIEELDPTIGVGHGTIGHQVPSIVPLASGPKHSAPRRSPLIAQVVLALRSAKPAISCVANGGQPGPSEYTDPNCASKNRQSIARESFTVHASDQ